MVLAISKPPFRKNKSKVLDDFTSTGQFVYAIGESPVLRKRAKRVSIKAITSLEVQSELRYLKSCLKRYKKLTGHGRGIAAPQVGIPEQFAVIWMPRLYQSIVSRPELVSGSKKIPDQVRNNKGDKLLTIINPRITKESKERLSYPEVCMSAFPLVAEVTRPSWIEFEYYDEKGRKKVWNTKSDTKLGRMLNRVFMHEIDHLQGIINIDKVPSNTLKFDLDPKRFKKAKFKSVRQK